MALNSKWIAHDWTAGAPLPSEAEKFEQVEFRADDNRDTGIIDPYAVKVEGTSTATPKPVLSLLFVVMDEKTVVVKVEKKREDIKCVVGSYGYNLPEGSSDLIEKPFADIRAAVDKMAEGEKPVPRLIYNVGGNDSFPYRILAGSDKGPCGSFLMQQDYDALSEIVGHPLPVYKERRGEWVQLPQVQVREGVKVKATDAWHERHEWPEGFEVWRFRMFDGE